ncbi:MAG: protein translocase subunit SecF [Robiginitomaculum sp.]
MFDISLIRFIPKNTKIPFINMRVFAIGLSLLAIIVSIFLYSTKELNYGLDFKGGTVWEFDIGEQPTDAITSDIREIGNSLGLGDVTLQTISQKEHDHDALRLAIGKQPALEGDENDDRAQQSALGKVKTAIMAKYPDTVQRGVQSLGTKVSGELKKRGAIAVILALVMVLLYIWVRFEWQFGLGAVAALAHDVTLTIGVFALTGQEFNLSIVAAILTIVGYSLNDTVIVYDRIRENLRKFKKMPLAEVLNLSINDTLSRTIMTSFTTLLALFALYFLGGPGLHGFSFAMIWGVFVGTYSSIFIASPILLLLGVNRGGLQKEG